MAAIFNASEIPRAKESCVQCIQRILNGSSTVFLVPYSVCFPDICSEHQHVIDSQRRASDSLRATRSQPRGPPQADQPVCGKFRILDRGNGTTKWWNWKGTFGTATLTWIPSAHTKWSLTVCNQPTWYTLQGLWTRMPWQNAGQTPRGWKNASNYWRFTRTHWLWPTRS